MEGEHDRSLYEESVVRHVKLDVLLIEQDSELAGTFKVELGHFGARVHRAEDLEEVFVLIEGKKLDAVLLDVTHPAFDPCHVISAVRRSSSNSGVPIVALVPHEEITLLERASRAGATHFLPKPIVWYQVHRLMQSIHWCMADDRRHYRRAKAAIPVLCTLNGRQAIGQSVDISSGGMLLKLEEELAVGTEVVTAFPYSEKVAASFLLPARVTRIVNTGTVALEFTNIPDDRAEKLLMWVDLFHYIEEGVIGSSIKG